MNTTMKRIRVLGVVLVAAGAAVAGVGFLYGLPMATDGLTSAQAMYEAQGIDLSYNDQGQLIDRGTPEGAQKIKNLLVNDWKFPVVESDFDPNDPLVNTRTELMFYYATITYHVLNGEVDVKLAADQVPITYRGVTYTEAGTYKIAPLEYYANLDRTHVIEGQLRAAWTPQALALTAALSSGHANQGVGELAQATSLGIGAVGGLFALAGAGLVWVSFGQATDLRRETRSPEVAGGPRKA